MGAVIEQHIEISPGTRGGRPRIAGTRMTVEDIVIMYLRQGRSLEEIAGAYDLALAAVYAAISYYYDHKAEIDRSIEDDLASVREAKKNNPSILRERLKALNGG